MRAAALLLALLALAAPAGLASSPRSPVETVVTWEGSGASGEPLVVRIVWHVAPNLRPVEFNATLDLPGWVRAEGATRWVLRSEPDRATDLRAEVVVTPTREGYWRAGVGTDAPFSTSVPVLSVRSLAGDGAVAREPEDVLPARAASVEASLGAWDATHAEVVVRGAKGAGWHASERLALAPAGHGSLSVVEGDAGEHRESFRLEEGVGLAFVATAYVQASFEGPAGEETTTRQRAIAQRCHTVGRTDGNVTLAGGECRYPGDFPLPLGAEAILSLVGAGLLAAAERRFRRT